MCDCIDVIELHRRLIEFFFHFIPLILFLHSYKNGMFLFSWTNLMPKYFYLCDYIDVIKLHRNINITVFKFCSINFVIVQRKVLEHELPNHRKFKHLCNVTICFSKMVNKFITYIPAYTSAKPGTMRRTFQG